MDTKKRALEVELDEVVSNMDNQGKSVHGLERALREMEKRCAEQSEQVQYPLFYVNVQCILRADHRIRRSRPSR